MILDFIIVGTVVAGAVAYLVWNFMPRPKKASGCPAPCGTCAAKSSARTP